jgi:3-hydroxybutyryl-CoA dehydratase
MRAERRVVVTENLVSRFVDLSGDINPLHTDEEFAKKSIFKKRVAHGFIPAIYFSALIGTELPGAGSILLSQTINFLKPVYIGAEILIIAEIDKVDIRKKIISIKTTCRVDELLVVDGNATVLFPM